MSDSELRDTINIKVNANWHTITADQDAGAVNCVCKYWTGNEVYEFFDIPEDVDLWRECDDGHDDELIPDHGEEILTFWDGDRMYYSEKANKRWGLKGVLIGQEDGITETEGSGERVEAVPRREPSDAGGVCGTVGSASENGPER